ncbi:hypothetical protein OF829_08225 [Sphingomonas sp. LB-2]|uniref:hypothetical protein n=1 Tax=Sphingomonas caeni TaxID=2984949 RepID=UPI00222F20EB|nr:hypothetical protein [Sphingomonas caeni]MCW3847225.1 hypothetical protein [Sphingomonas caeni]
MLRSIVLIAAGIMLLCALTLAGQDPGAWPMAAMAALFVAGTLFERFHYRGSTELDGDWQPTSERFIDEESGRPVTVWFNPRTGARRYVDAETPS